MVDIQAVIRGSVLAALKACIYQCLLLHSTSIWNKIKLICKHHIYASITCYVKFKIHLVHIDTVCIPVVLVLYKCHGRIRYPI